ncbi:hypothetical protein GHT07_19095 [Caenimonas koreensis DSM 17982]|uniref:Type IV secretion system protein VirB5 n=1 Tax=Caenimonas koreensis DSM 17982 TaxID=1121255 RepID=A0A844B3N4_9BURK|nr:type IV secretion system protein [Caenimonas koreensis]MRD49388.1 hypothetical protein [Caenimonas koreensis DSM 17982]
MKFFRFIDRVKAVLGALVLVAAGAAHAQIPVTDVASVTTQVSNQVESIAKWVQQFNQMQQQITQFQQQYTAITGARGMGGLLDNPALRSALPSDWQSIITQVKSTAAYATERQKYPTFPNLPKTTALYDVVAAQNATMSDLYAKSNGRLQQIQSLMGQIDSASDPAAKQDLANRLISEQNNIQATNNLVTILQRTQKQELEVASQQAVKELSCKEFKNCS